MVRPQTSGRDMEDSEKKTELVEETERGEE